jgi:hypothetical protein
MGKDSEIVTLAFTVKSEAAGNDLSDWFERGYDWVLDAQVSEGEIKPGQYLVFVEMNRRSSVPKRIIELLEDLFIYRFDDLAILEISDLRAGFAFIIAAAIRKNPTYIRGISLVERGYERLDIKLKSLGMDIEKILFEFMYVLNKLTFLLLEAHRSALPNAWKYRLVLLFLTGFHLLVFHFLI